MTPLPPVGPGIPFSVAPVMFGQYYTLTPGALPVGAVDDGVLISYLGADGQLIGGQFLTVQEAMAFGYAISTAAGMTINRSVGDDGRKLPLPERLRRLSGK